MFWQVSHLPRCTHDVFLSHCAEDREDLVLPVYRSLQTKAIVPWVDRHHYPRGTPPYEALREGLLRCRHIIYFGTPSMLNQGRGWAILEKAFGGILQDNLTRSGTELCHLEFPLIFVDRGDETLQRSVWAPILSRGKVRRVADRDPVAWATREIELFVNDQRRRALDLIGQIENDSAFRSTLNSPIGLLDRICSVEPIFLKRPSRRRKATD